MISPVSWMATIFLTLTMPVSRSTTTSANWQPPTPTLESPSTKLPVSEIDDVPSLRQASFHDITGSPATQSCPSLSDRSSGLALYDRGDLLEERIPGLGDRVVARRRHRRRRGRAARGLARRERRVADVRDDVGRLEAEDLRGDDRQDRPGAGADVLGGRLAARPSHPD